MPLHDICLGDMFEYRLASDRFSEDGFDEKDGTPINTPLIRIGNNTEVDIKDGYLLAVDPYTGSLYMIPRYKNVIPLESELTVKK